jgi:hypothetical protein
MTSEQKTWKIASNNTTCVLYLYVFIFSYILYSLKTYTQSYIIAKVSIIKRARENTDRVGRKDQEA